MYAIDQQFHLPQHYVADLKARPVPWGGGLLSAATYYDRYSRKGEYSRSGQQEHFADTIQRNIEGVFSIRKTWYHLIGQRWDEREMQKKAMQYADLAFDMKWLPPGRSLYSLGTGYPETRGNASLNNCGYVDIRDKRMSEAAYWMCDHLMLGVGVGFRVSEGICHIFQPTGDVRTFQIPDSREGWAESFLVLVQTYEEGANPVVFDYSLVRPKGAPIAGFGGIASGPEPLRKAHEVIRSLFEKKLEHETDPIIDVELQTDIMNLIGECVIAGNVRRSAEIAVGSPTDERFINLKNYGHWDSKTQQWDTIGPAHHRLPWGYLSNNSVWLSDDQDFESIPTLVGTLLDRGEPGFINGKNIRTRGRYTDRVGAGQWNLREDLATGMNPCGEIPLWDRELCNLVETFPMRCKNQGEWNEVLKAATFFASTVALLPSHDPGTNAVVAHNRRIGVSASGVADWVDSVPFSLVHRWLDDGYHVVRAANRALAMEAGVPESIRVTTIKPSGTVSLLPWASPGMHHPVKNRFIRRIKFSSAHPVSERLSAAGVPWELDDNDPNTLVFEFPMLSANGGRTRSVEQVPFAEQCALQAFLGRVWADNAVSFTGTINKHDIAQAERIITMHLPLVKSMSALVNQEVETKYRQLPYEAIGKDEYEARVRVIRDISWDDYTGSDGQDERYCGTDACEVSFGG